MKEFTQGGRPRILLVGKATPAPDQEFDFTPTALRRSFEGWLRTVTLPEDTFEDVSQGGMYASAERAPEAHLLKAISTPNSREKSPLTTATHPDRLRLLTTQDITRVMLVTLREGFEHRRWPMEVVKRFLAAEVIASGNGHKPARKNS